MLLKILILAMLPVCPIRSQAIGVCELLHGLEDLKGTEISVRGVWAVGDTGEILYPESPCASSTVRDGWVWSAVISVAPRDTNARGFQNEYWRLRGGTRPHQSVKIVATLTGRLETRNHFDVQKLANGRRVPRAFRFWVAELTYIAAADFEVVPYRPGEEEDEMHWRRDPWAKPASAKSK